MTMSTPTRLAGKSADVRHRNSEAKDPAHGCQPRGTADHERKKDPDGQYNPSPGTSWRTPVRTMSDSYHWTLMTELRIRKIISIIMRSG
ncbi:hypothetical protein Dimus_038019 [Dionaea muscipula]